METSAPKRRKTSPTSNVQLSGSDASAPSSSSEAARRSSGRRRPSFASPTRASLARTNPELLIRRNIKGVITQARPAARSQPPTVGGDEGDEGDEQAVTAQLEGASENRPTSDPIAPETGTGPTISEPQSPIRQSLGGMRGKPRRSLNKPSPRPLPPPSAQEEELLDPFKGRMLRRSPPRGVLPPQEPEDPELPPTPTEKGISDPNAVNSSPMGIHNTPSKRPRRSRALADKLRSGSSPLKQLPMRPIDLRLTPKGPSQAPGTTSKTALTIFGSPSSQPARRAPKATSTVETEPNLQREQDDVPIGKPHPARGVQEFDPFREKKHLRDSLLAEAAQLETDLETLQNENDMLYAGQQRRRFSSAVYEPKDPTTLINILGRHVLPLEKEQLPEPSQMWLDAALDPVSFLPFGNQSVVLPNPFQPAEEEHDQPPPISHHPIALTADEELPYLQLFTPLSFTSTTAFVPRDLDNDDEAEPLMHQYNISVSSNPPGLFAARIEMLVNTKTLSISELAVPKLEPAAVTELGPFVTKILDSEAGSVSALKRNISVLTWAMAEWTRLATRRARFWCLVTKELGDERGVLDCAKQMREGRRRKRSQKDSVDSNAESSDEDVDSARKERFAKSQLFPLLGRPSFDLDLSLGGQTEVELRVNWNIGFDWTGEGHNTIGVLVQAPAKWHTQDERGSLTGIPALFDKLLQDGSEPIYALKTVVALLVGDGEA
ncbi:hypothetical protein AB5N19_01791 [Seiridium cardinale]